MKRNHALNWQTDPNKLNTQSGTVQYWSATGGMITAQMPIETARKLVIAGKAYVITSQAVGQYESSANRRAPGRRRGRRLK